MNILQHKWRVASALAVCLFVLCVASFVACGNNALLALADGDIPVSSGGSVTSNTISEAASALGVSGSASKTYTGSERGSGGGDSWTTSWYLALYSGNKAMFIETETWSGGSSVFAYYGSYSQSGSVISFQGEKRWSGSGTAATGGVSCSITVSGSKITSVDYD